MKKIALINLVLLFNLFIACNKEDNRKNVELPNLSEKSIIAKQQYMLTTDTLEEKDETLNAYFFIEFPKAPNEILNRIVKKDLTKLLLSVKDSFKQARKEDIGNKASREIEYSLELTLDESYIDHNWISLRFAGYLFEGGIHGLPFFISINYDQQKQRIIEFNDLFSIKTPADTLQFKRIINDALIEADYSGASLESLYPLKFNRNADSLTFCFDAYEVAPYAMGMPVINFNKQELASFLQNSNW